MKRLFTLSLSLLILGSAFSKSSVVVLPAKPVKLNANQLLVPIGKNGEKVSLMDLSTMRVKDYEEITGKKMNLSNKLAFKIIQKKLRNNMDANGNLNTKIVASVVKITHKTTTDKTRSYLRLWLIFLGIAIVLGLIASAVPFFWILSSLAGIGALIFFVLWLLSLSGTM
jgi:hypothetical protein